MHRAAYGVINLSNLPRAVSDLKMMPVIVAIKG